MAKALANVFACVQRRFSDFNLVPWLALSRQTYRYWDVVSGYISFDCLSNNCGGCDGDVRVNLVVNDVPCNFLPQIAVLDSIAAVKRANQHQGVNCYSDIECFSEHLD